MTNPYACPLKGPWSVIAAYLVFSFANFAGLTATLHAQSCPTITVVEGPTAGVCEFYPFDVQALGLSNFTENENGEQDYDLQLVWLPAGSIADPYIEGTVLATTTPFNGAAFFTNVPNDLPQGDYDLYTILSPTPIDPDCRPQPTIPITVSPCNLLGDFVFLDFADDGIYNDSDIPLPGIAVEVFNAETDETVYELATATTDLAGKYAFGLVASGDYYLSFEGTPNVLALVPGTGLGIGPNNTNNFDPDQVNGVGTTPDFAFSGEQPDTTLDVAFIGTGTISGRIWPDDDFGNDPNETGVTDVVLELRWAGLDQLIDTEDDVLLTTLTQADGLYAFEYLPHGPYRLRIQSTANTILAAGYDLISPAATTYTFTLDGDGNTFLDNDFMYQPQCLPSTASFTTLDPLVMCGNEELGIYPNQPIRVRINDFVVPASIAEDYEFWLVVVNENGEIIQSDRVLNPDATPTVVVDLTALPIGEYGIYGLHYLTTDPDLTTPFDFSVGNDFATITDELSLNNGAPATGLVCGDVSLTAAQGALQAGMDPQPPVFLGCIGSVNASLNADCAIQVTPQMVLSGDWGCLIPSDFQIDIYANGQLISDEGRITGCGTYEYRIDALVPDIDGFPCWGYINAFDNRAPRLTCPSDIDGDPDFLCSDLDSIQFTNTQSYLVDGSGQIVDIDPEVAAVLEITGYPTVTDGCDFVRVSISDHFVENGSCGEAYLERSFRAADKVNSTCTGNANQSPICIQRIYIRRPNINTDLILPPEVVELDCSNFATGTNPTPDEIIAALDTFGYPAVRAYFDADPDRPGFQAHSLDQVYCTLGAAHQDLPRIQGCGSSYSFLREWSIIDDCNVGSSVVYRQLIRIKDFTDPILVLPIVDYNGDNLPDVRRFTTSTAACEAYIRFPDPTELSDFCAGPPTLTIKVRDEGGTLLYNGPITNLVTLPMGNYVVEYCAVDDCNNQSCATMPIIVFDGIAPSMACNDELNVRIGGGDINNDLFGIARIQATSIDEGSTDNCSPELVFEVRRNFWREDDCGFGSQDFSPWAPFVDFLCCDVGREVRVELRATDEAGNENICWMVVTPEDQLRPQCFAPAPVSMTCAEWPTYFEGDIAEAYANDFGATSQMMTDLFGGPGGTDNCRLDTLVERTPSININACGWGSITRRFQAWQWLGDANGNGRIDAAEVIASTNTCTQRITLTETHHYIIDFPEDTEADCAEPVPADLFTETLGCDDLVVNTSTPQRFNASGDECYKISVTYDIINWCIWDGEADAYVIPRQTDTDNNQVDRCERPVLRVDDNQAVIDRRHSESGCSSNLANEFVVPTTENVGRWQYSRFIKVYDTEAPTVSIQPFGGPTELCPDLSASTFGAVDNETCSAPVTIDFSLADACETFNQSGDLVLEVTNVAVDWLSIDANGDSVIGAQEFTVEETLTASVSSLGGTDFRFNYPNAPIIYGEQGDNLYHALRLTVSDGCGNVGAAYVTFSVVDCKAPAPSCRRDLVAVLTPNAADECEAVLWASDFPASPIIDCSNPVQLAIYRATDVVAAGPDFVPNPVDTSIVFTLEDAESTVAVYVYAIDAAGNTDFCEAFVEVQTGLACLLQGAIGGMIMTEESRPVSGVTVNLSGPMPMMTTTAADGAYRFENLEEDLDYTVSAFLDDEHDNGVTTFDLVLISKHILTTQPLDSPYKLIAADVNRSGSVTTLDMIQIRKVILRLNETFPDNTSWRFIDEDYNFPEPTNPWVEFFPELINLNDLVGELDDAGFIGVKIGDVNGSADLGQ